MLHGYLAYIMARSASATLVVMVGSFALYATSPIAPAWLTRNAGLVALSVVQAIGINGHIGWMVDTCA